MSARLLVTGSRLLTAERHAGAIEEGLAWCGQLLGRDTVLVVGDCPPGPRKDRHGVQAITEGADELAARRWHRWRLPIERHVADWGTEGVSAGPRRNERMVASLGAGPALCMAWPHPDPAERSAGTWGCVALALAANVTVLDGWTRLPILSVPALPPRPPVRDLPHREVMERELSLGG